MYSFLEYGVKITIASVLMIGSIIFLMWLGRNV